MYTVPSLNNLCRVSELDQLTLAYSWFSRDVTTAMLVYRTIAQRFFWELDSVIMQNLSDILPLFCTPTWPSHHVSENQELTMPDLTNSISSHFNCLNNKVVFFSNSSQIKTASSCQLPKGWWGGWGVGRSPGALNLFFLRTGAVSLRCLEP